MVARGRERARERRARYRLTVNYFQAARAGALLLLLLARAELFLRRRLNRSLCDFYHQQSKASRMRDIRTLGSWEFSFQTQTGFQMLGQVESWKLEGEDDDEARSLSKACSVVVTMLAVPVSGISEFFKYYCWLLSDLATAIVDYIRVRQVALSSCNGDRGDPCHKCITAAVCSSELLFLPPLLACCGSWQCCGLWLPPLPLLF